MTPARYVRTNLLPVLMLITCVACSGGGGSSGGNAPSPSEGPLPWTGSFTESAPDATTLDTLAGSVEAEMREVVSPDTRTQVEDHISDTLSGSLPVGRSKAPTYQFEPENEGEAFLMAGNGAVLMGDLNLALWAFSRAVIHAPEDPHALNQFAWSLIASGRFTEAKQVLLFLTRNHPELWTAWSSLGYLYEQSDDPERASFCYQMALYAHPDSVFVNVKLGALLLRQGDVGGAAIHAGQALAVNPENTEARLLEEQIEEAGGSVTPVEPSAYRHLTGSAASNVRSAISDCSDEHATWMAEQMRPVLEKAIRDGYTHRDNKIRLGATYTDCNNDCLTDPGSADSCWLACDMEYCSMMAGEISRHHALSINSIQQEMGIAAAYRARFRSCAYDAIEDRIHDLSDSDVTALYEYVDWMVRLNEASYSTAIEDEVAYYRSAVTDISSACDQESILEALEAIAAEEGRGPLFDHGMEACADGFVCLTFGETTIGFSVGVGFASGGVTADYVNPDLIFSLGVAADSGVAAVGIDAKLSIQRGIGLSPVVKYGGPIRATISRDIWLYSF